MSTSSGYYNQKMLDVFLCLMRSILSGKEGEIIVSELYDDVKVEKLDNGIIINKENSIDILGGPACI